MLGSAARRTPSIRRMTGAATVAAVAVGMVSLAPTAQGQDNPEPAGYSNARVHRDAGKPLFAKSNETPAARVKAYLKGRGLSDLTVGSLTAQGGQWKSRGVTHLRMEQRVAGLRVQDAYAHAAFDSTGRLVDLVENVATVPNGAPQAASVDAADALRAAVGHLYPGRSVDTRTTGRSQNTTTFAQGGWHAEPTVERVALRTTDNGLEVGYVVTTWTADDNELYETVVGGDGKVVDTILRSANESYNVFPKDPAATPQQMVTDPADATASPNGWLSGSQTRVNIGGNNAHAYLDTDNDNAADAGGAPVTDGVFGTAFDAGTKPSTDSNREVAVQNLFFLNNLIHDTLYKAGFTEAVGNFQQDNYGNGGRAGDPVAAEAQDGGGTDNANFATPADGQDPRMQMYLWSVPGMYEVNVPTGPAAGSYDAAVGEWAPVTADGVSGPLALGDDSTGTTSDACEALTGDMTGKVVIVDRGTCTFIIKAKNVQAAGAAGMIVANNVAGAAFPMGGTDRKVKIPGLMVSQADGATLKTALGSSATLRLNPNSIMRDGDLDTDIVWHEYGHGLTWRMIGRMDGPLAGAIGEGMSDVLSVIVNDDPVVGEYSASDPSGIRSHSYEGYPDTYGDIKGTEVHADGELYGAIGWDLWKQYKAANLGKSVILADLVDGMNYTPAKPTYEQMRDGIVAGLTASGNQARICAVQDAFAKYGVGVGAKGVVRGSSVTVTESFKSACGTDFTPAPAPAP